MKTKEQIVKWGKCHTINKRDVDFIKGYLFSLGYDISDIHLKSGANKICREDFRQWFESDNKGTISAKVEVGVEVKNCSECSGKNNILLCMEIPCQNYVPKQESKPQPKYKSGDWVRLERRILEVERWGITNGDVSYTLKDFPSVVPENHLEPATPKEGEFWDIRTDANLVVTMYIEKVSDCRIQGININSFDSNVGKGYVLKKYIDKYSPSTELQKQKLINRVEQATAKTFNGKEWVDMLNIHKEEVKTLKELNDRQKEKIEIILIETNELYKWVEKEKRKLAKLIQLVE